MPRSARKPRNAAPRPELEDVTAGLAPLSANQIKLFTDSGSFTRGRKYQRDGHIFQPIRRGTTIQAFCQGSSGGPYHVWATLATDDQPSLTSPTSASCNCLRGGFCQHIVALVLTWIEQPEKFAMQPTVPELLAGRSREQLVELIDTIITAVPELIQVLEMPDLETASLTDDPVDERAIRRQIDAAIPNERTNPSSVIYGFDEAAFGEDGRFTLGSFGSSGINTGVLEHLVALGESYGTAKQWRNALSVFATLVEQVAPRLGEGGTHAFGSIFFEFGDEGGLEPVLSQCDTALAALLEMQAKLPEAERFTAEERDRLIEALYTIWAADVEAGGLDLARYGPMIISRAATPEERHQVGAWVRALLTPETSQSSQPSPGAEWRSRAAIWFLVLLGPDGGLSEEQALTEYRNAGLWADAADLLFQTGRVEESVALAARHLPEAEALVSFASLLVGTGDSIRIEQAIKLVDDCLWEREGKNPNDDEILSTWLQHHLAEHGRPDEALKLARRLFEKQPSYQTYEAVRELATLPERTGESWDKMRPSLLTSLTKQKDWPALATIHLEAAELPEGLAAFKRVEPNGTFAYWWPDMAEYVAAAVAPTLPDEAIPIYQTLAGKKIEARNRESYRAAANFLAEERQLLLAGGREDEWLTKIARLREQHKTLRALQDELNKRGLE